GRRAANGGRGRGAGGPAAAGDAGAAIRMGYSGHSGQRREAVGQTQHQGRGSLDTASFSAQAPAEIPISATSATAFTATPTTSVSSTDGVGCS
ncbi:MAG TPA: hypothetical protein VME01_03185, partial [Solirubrobacteraceae bacterium]|nr:hypothetical protein [Solirubrobacteraceae bacterium]